MTIHKWYPSFHPFPGNQLPHLLKNGRNTVYNLSLLEIKQTLLILHNAGKPESTQINLHFSATQDIYTKTFFRYQKNEKIF